MTAQQPHTPPPDDVADGMVRELDALGVLWSAVERLARTAEDLPGWVQVLGPWKCEEEKGREWARWTRNRTRGEGYRAFEVYWASGSWWTCQLGWRRQGPFDTRNGAMCAADATAREEWVFPEAIPPEEAPAAEPTPAPDPQPRAPGPGRRTGEHSWWAVEELGLTKRSIYPAILSRCEDCGLWRVGGRRYFPADMRVEAVRRLWREDGAGATKAGQCPGERRP